MATLSPRESLHHNSSLPFTIITQVSCTIYIIRHRIRRGNCCYVYIPGTTYLHILLHIRVYINIYYSQYTVLHILSHYTSYSLFYFIICSYFHSHLYIYIYIYIFSCNVSLFYCFFVYSLFYWLFIFALSIERTCPDLHFTTDYTLYDCVCDK